MANSGKGTRASRVHDPRILPRLRLQLAPTGMRAARGVDDNLEPSDATQSRERKDFAKAGGGGKSTCGGEGAKAQLFARARSKPARDCNLSSPRFDAGREFRDACKGCPVMESISSERQRV